MSADGGRSRGDSAERRRGVQNDRRSRSAHSLRASGDRWLFGYADIVTLLFACFASLYVTGLTPAVTPTVVAAVAEPSDAAADPTGGQSHPASVSAHEVELTPREMASRPRLEDALEERLDKNPRLPGVEIVPDRRGLVISLPEAGSFAPGRTELSSSAQLAILDLALELAQVPNLVRVEGHTDDVPIRTAEFVSNWDLSTARATRVVRLLIDEGGLNPDRLSAAGYAEHRPRQPNTTAAARARNRRVDIVVLEPGTGNGEPGTDPRSRRD
jgi:chemotaxis protein MotB